MAQRRDRIPGIPVDAERNINQVTGALDSRLKRLELKRGRAGIVTSDTSAKPGEFLNVEAPASGLTVMLPAPTPALLDARVTLCFRNTNPVRLVALSGGLVNRLAFVINTSVGTFEAICDGLGGWAVETGLSASGSATSAQYVLGAAHGGLPNAAVGTDTAEVDFSFAPGGTATWVLRAASVVFAKLQDLTGLSVLGRAANSAGVMAAITASAARQVLKVNDAGTSLAWGDPLGVQDDNVPQGDVHTLDFTSSASIVAAAAVASREGAVTHQRAALAGAIAAAQNSNTTRFAGIRTNGALQTARQFLNLIDTSTITWTPADDSPNDEWEMRANLALASVTPRRLAPDVQTLSAGTYHDLAIADTVTSIVCNGNVTITGIAGGWHGREIGIAGGNNGTLTLEHNSASSSVGNRFTLPAGINYIQARGGARLGFDTGPSEDLWRCSGTAINPLDVRKNSTGTVFSAQAPELNRGRQRHTYGCRRRRQRRGRRHGCSHWHHD